ncbi:alkaline phosphatase family protein [Polaribacter ponticola]|uniref:alkaline phosphatase family protein n=1 Tax=Polaribacter ponticola TaxID=2978475 RepID=UPI0030823CBB
MKNILIFLSVSSFLFFGCKSQKKNQQKPKLVVGIVIDQMRYDYLTRFSDRYGNDGFKKLLKHGFSLENAHYNYIPTYTAVGHTSIYTGTTPDNHGIISNNWYDKFLKKSIYCVDDTNFKTIGNNGIAGKKSPFRMQTTTVTDQLHLAQNMKGKTIGVAIKDRSAILPAGHTANAAYWFDGKKMDNGFLLHFIWKNCQVG